MVDDKLSKVEDVDIDPRGTFKYVLIKVYEEGSTGEEKSKQVVRGYKWGSYHGKL